MKHNTKITLGLVGLLSLSGCLFDSDEEKDTPSLSSSVEISSSLVTSSTEVEASSALNVSSAEIQSSSSIEMSSAIVLNDAKFFYVGSDYSSGSLECLTAEGLSCSPSLNIFNDSYTFKHNGSLYILEAMGADNLVKVNVSGDASVSYQNKLIDAADTISANPKSMAFINDTEAWIGFFGTDKLVKVNLVDGSVIQTVDIPETEEGVNAAPSALAIVDDKLYAALQRLDATWSAQIPHILVLDAESGVIQDTIIATKPNINSLIVKDGNLISIASGNTSYDADWVATSALDGGIEMIDLANNSVSLIADETKIGGKPASLVFGNDNQAWITYGPFGAVKTSSFDIATGMTGTALVGTANSDGGLEYDSKTNTLFVLERGLTESGVILFRADTLYKEMLNKDKLAPYNGTILRRRK